MGVGTYEHEVRARQLIRFDGMNLGKKRFTDFDAVTEYDNRAWLVFEVKYGNKEVPYGQRLALERFVNDTAATGKHAVAAVVEHYVSNPREDIYLKNCVVRQVYLSGERSWRPPSHPLSARRLLIDYVSWVDSRHIGIPSYHYETLWDCNWQ